jgi:hypothetical protein
MSQREIQEPEPQRRFLGQSLAASKQEAWRMDGFSTS